MLAILVSLPVLAGLLILQSAIVSRMQLLNGSADLVLLAILAWALQKRVQTAWHWSIIGGLMVAMASALPFVVPLVTYPLAAAVALLLRQRVWQVPLLAMFVATFTGTLITHAFSLTALRLVGEPLPLGEALNLVTLPSLLINLLLAIPIYALIGDLAANLYPEELEV